MEIKRINIARLAAILIWSALAYVGIAGWINQWSQCDTLGRQIHTLAQLAYGVLSVVLVIIHLRSRRTPKVLAVIWGLAITMATGMAPIVWGSAGLVASAAAAVSGLLLVMGSLWLAHRGSRALTSRLN